MEVLEAYNNLEKMVSYGFLSVGMKYGPTNFVFKTINDKEAGLLKIYNQNQDPFLDAVCKIALCTLMLDGRNLIKNRDENMPELIDFYKKLSSSFVSEISQNISIIQGDSLESTEFLEGFCYSNRSKHLWRILKNHGMASDRVYGMEGCDLLGSSYTKETWILFNNSMEEEEDHYQKMKIALLIASSMSPKGAKDASTRMENQKKLLDDYRSEVSKFGKDQKRLEEKSKNSWTAPMDTREDVVRELNKQMRGDKDKHDLFIDKYLEEMRIRTENQKKSMVAKQESYRSSLVQNLDQEGSISISAEEMEKRIRSKKTPGVSIVEDQEKMTVEKKERFLTKISPKVIKSRT